jgi:hypothetical protein
MESLRAPPAHVIDLLLQSCGHEPYNAMDSNRPSSGTGPRVRNRYPVEAQRIDEESRDQERDGERIDERDGRFFLFCVLTVRKEDSR